MLGRFLSVVRRILTAVAILFPGFWLIRHSATGGELVSTVVYSIGIGLIGAFVWLVLEIAFYNGGMPNSRLVRICFAFTLVAAVSIGLTQWPLRASFAVWKGEIESVRKSIEAGRVDEPPSRIGTFPIARTEMMGDRYPALVLHDPDGNPIRLICTTENDVGNTWSEIRLDENWVLNAED